MVLRSLGSRCTGTVIIALTASVIGGVLITADSTNDTTVKIYKAPKGVVDTGKVIFDIVTKIPLFVCAPFEASDHVQLVCSGTGAGAQLFEWMT